MPEKVTEFLRNAKGLTNEQRAELWDAFYQSRDVGGLTSALESIEAPREIKAELWDMKAGGGDTAPESAAPETAPSGGVSPGGVTGFMAGAGRAIGRGVAGAAPYLDPMSLAAKVSRAAGEAVGAGTLPQTPVEMMSAEVAGAPAMQPPAPGDPNAGVQNAGATAGNIAMLMAGGRGAGAVAQRVGGPMGRALTSPALWGGVAGADTLRRTGSPLAAAEAGAGGYLAAKAGGAVLTRAPGALGRLARLLGLRGRAASPATQAAARAPGQTAAVRPPGAAPPPGGARGARGMQALATPAQAAPPRTSGPTAWTPSSQHPVGAPASAGGTTAKGTLKTPKPRELPPGVSLATRGPLPPEEIEAIRRLRNPQGVYRDAPPTPTMTPEQARRMTEAEAAEFWRSASGGKATAPRTQTVHEALRMKPAGGSTEAIPIEPKSIEKFVRDHSRTHSRAWIIRNLRDAGIREHGWAAKMVDMILEAGT